MHQYEVEIKSLLGSKENADALKEKLAENGLTQKSKHAQLNHYFNEPEDLQAVYDAVEPLIPDEKEGPLKRIVAEGKKVSIRTREADGKVIFVMKASVGDDTSANGVIRIEFEGEVDKTLDELDQILLGAGLTYQAKWSREREEYASDSMNVSIDRNAGYGYLAEFEKITEDQDALGALREELLGIMESFGVSELPQDRLERMFEHYNNNWEKYYGTDNIFVIE